MISITSVFHWTTSLRQSQILPHHQLSKKLSNKYTGPFEIIVKPGIHSFTIRLPESMQGVHPVFHVSMLKPATSNEIANWTQSPPPPIDINGKPELEIAEDIDSKIDK